MNRTIKKVEEPYLKTGLSAIGPGDTVKVVTKVVEGDKSRLQTFEGVVISIQGEGMGKTVKVRKISYGVGVERTFPLHSPNVDSFQIVKKGAPRRAKLFYLRDRVGKRALKVKSGKKKSEYAELTAPLESRESAMDGHEEVVAQDNNPEAPKTDKAVAVEAGVFSERKGVEAEAKEKIVTSPDSSADTTQDEDERKPE